MERTNYVAKAKSLMMSTVRTTALVIVPLAAAVNAHASSVTLPTGNFGCSTTQDSISGSCSGGDAQILPDPGSGVQGISFFTSADAYFGLSSGSSNSISLTMKAGGYASGDIPVGTAIPLSAIFDLTTAGFPLIVDWNLDFSLGTSAGDATYGFTTLSCFFYLGDCAGHFDLTSVLHTISAVSGGAPLWETVTLSVDAYGEPADPGSVTISVPQATSWDFGSVAATTSAVPEPASLGLMASGLALIGAQFRRRKR